LNLPPDPLFYYRFVWLMTVRADVSFSEGDSV